MAATTVGNATASSFWHSSSEAREMLSGDAVVGGVEVSDALLDELEEELASVSVGVLLEKLASHGNGNGSAAAGAVSVVAMMATMGW